MYSYALLTNLPFLKRFINSLAALCGRRNRSAEDACTSSRELPTDQLPLIGGHGAHGGGIPSFRGGLRTMGSKVSGSTGAEWLNGLIVNLWPYIGQAAAQTMKGGSVDGWMDGWMGDLFV